MRCPVELHRSTKAGAVRGDHEDTLHLYYFLEKKRGDGDEWHGVVHLEDLGKVIQIDN